MWRELTPKCGEEVLIALYGDINALNAASKLEILALHQIKYSIQTSNSLASNSVNAPLWKYQAKYWRRRCASATPTQNGVKSIQLIATNNWRIIIPYRGARAREFDRPVKIPINQWHFFAHSRRIILGTPRPFDYNIPEAVCRSCARWHHAGGVNKEAKNVAPDDGATGTSAIYV